MSNLRFEEASSKLTIETRAVGMLAKLAHDLSIVASGLRVDAKPSGDAIALELRVPVERVRVDGVRKGATVDRGTLSASDRATIEGKIREEVLRASEVVVAMQAKVGDLGEGKRDVEAEGTLSVGRASTKLRARVTLDVRDGLAKATGSTRVSLGSLGITPPKGPLGAFRVEDEVGVSFELAFARDAAS
jgi:hypothetical protein